MAYTVLSY